LFHGRSHLVSVKCVALLTGATLGVVVGGGSGAAFPAAVVLAYGCWVAPSLAVERRAKGRRREAETAVGPFLERLDAIVAAGRPVETAIVALARVPTASHLLDAALRRAAESYVLGAPLFRALSAAADREGIGSLGAVAGSLERSRDLGRGSLAVIRDARDAARAAERAASLAASSQVEGKLMLTLVLCYLPALMLLVVIPLFLTLLDGLFG
jgi:pilus assembly protein TadC